MSSKLDGSLIGRLREFIISKWNISERALVAWCSAMGLALLFGGIWLGDSQIDGALDSNYSVLVMRVFSFFIYLAFFFVVIKRTKDPNFNIRRFFSMCICVSLVCLAAGFAAFVWAEDYFPAGSDPHIALWACFFLTKVIGAPATIALVCVFSQLGRKLTFRLSILGILGAFVIYSCISQMYMPEDPFCPEKLLLAIALMACACLCAALGLNKGFFAGGSRSQEELVEQHVIKRPTEQVLTRGMFLMVVFSAITLGYLRSGFIGTDAHLQPASIVVLLCVIIISLLRSNLRIEHIFNFALLCTACSILLRPFLLVTAPVAITLLVNTGTALFEVVVWCWAVWVARNAQDSLISATAIRLATVTGHLIGTLLVAAALLVSSEESVSNTAGMLVILIFLLQTTVVLHKPNSAPPVMTIEEESSDTFLFPIIHEVYSADAKQAELSPAQEPAPTAQLETPSEASQPQETGEPITTQEHDHDKVQLTSADGSTPQAQESPSAFDEKAAVHNEDTDTTAPANEATDAPAQGAVDFEEIYWIKPLGTIAEAYRLTRREREVLGLLARGHSFAAMENELCISHNTMKMHARNIYTKLEVHSRQDVINMVETTRKQLASNA